MLDMFGTSGMMKMLTTFRGKSKSNQSGNGCPGTVTAGNSFLGK